LKDKLYKQFDWGKERTDTYYSLWENGENTNVINSAYVELFKSSDAMIHDCSSFIIEYLYIQKPVLYLMKDDRCVLESTARVGRKSLDCHYQAFNADEIENFLVNVVLNEDDPLKSRREHLYKECLLPPNGCTAAENMLNEIKKELGR